MLLTVLLSLVATPFIVFYGLKTVIIFRTMRSLDRSSIRGREYDPMALTKREEMSYMGKNIVEYFRKGFGLQKYEWETHNDCVKFLEKNDIKIVAINTQSLNSYFLAQSVLNNTNLCDSFVNNFPNVDQQSLSNALSKKIVAFRGTEYISYENNDYFIEDFDYQDEKALMSDRPYSERKDLITKINDLEKSFATNSISFVLADSHWDNYTENSKLTENLKKQKENYVNSLSNRSRVDSELMEMFDAKINNSEISLLHHLYDFLSNAEKSTFDKSLEQDNESTIKAMHKLMNT